MPGKGAGGDPAKEVTSRLPLAASSSPQGTRRTCSPGPLPPVRSAMRTASWTKKALDSRRAPFHLPARLGHASFQIQLTPVVGHSAGDCEAQQGDPGRRSRDHRSLQPTLELPPDPVHNGSGGEGPFPPPTALQRLSVLGLCFDEQLGGDEAVRSETSDELVGKPHGKKSQGVSPVRRRIELPGDHEVGRGVPKSKWSLVETVGKPVGRSCPPSRTGPALRCGRTRQTHRECGCPDGGAGRRAGRTEHIHWEVAEPLLRRTSTHDRVFAAASSRCERSVGNPHPDGGSGAAAPALSATASTAAPAAARTCSARGLPAEVTGGGTGGQGTAPWPGDFYLGSKGRDRQDDRFKAACVPSLVLPHDDKVRTACLGFSASLPETDPLRPGGKGSGDDPVGRDYHGRSVGEPGGNEGPVGTPDDERANRGHADLKPAAAAGPVSSGWLRPARRPQSRAGGS